MNTHYIELPCGHVHMVLTPPDMPPSLVLRLLMEMSAELPECDHPSCVRARTAHLN